jgi:hypothetical protein
MTSRVLPWMTAALAAAAIALVPARPTVSAASPAAPQTPAAQSTPQTPVPATDAQPVFRSGVKLVLVDVSVTGDGDQPLADLMPADFELTEDGLPQQVEQATLVRLDGAPRGNGEALPAARHRRSRTR